MKEINDQQFKELSHKKGVYLVDIWAPWCQPCKRLGPILEDLSQNYLGSVEFCKLDADQNPESCAELGVRSIPTVVILKDGQIVNTLLGLQPASKYIDALTKII